jgi:hypothetical protein
MVVKQYQQYRRSGENGNEHAATNNNTNTSPRMKAKPRSRSRSRSNSKTRNASSRERGQRVEEEEQKEVSPRRHVSTPRGHRSSHRHRHHQNHHHRNGNAAAASATMKNHNKAESSKSIDSYRAETAAKRLEMELRLKGYDPNTGGQLLQKESFSSQGSSDDCDKYWQTPEQESRSLEDYYVDDDDDDDYGDFTTTYDDEEEEEAEDEQRDDDYNTKSENTWEDRRRRSKSRRPVGVGRYSDSDRRDTTTYTSSSYEESTFPSKTMPKHSGADWTEPRQVAVTKNNNKAVSRNRTRTPPPQRRRQPYYSSSSNSFSSSSGLSYFEEEEEDEEEESFISKLQDPRLRNPEYGQQRPNGRRHVNAQGRRPGSRHFLHGRRDNNNNNNNMEEEESIFQLHKRPTTNRANMDDQRDPPPLATTTRSRPPTVATPPHAQKPKSPSSAMTRPVNNTAVHLVDVEEEDDRHHHHHHHHHSQQQQKQSQQLQRRVPTPTSPYRSHDMAGRIQPTQERRRPSQQQPKQQQQQQQQFFPTKEKRQGPRVKEMSSQSFDVVVNTTAAAAAVAAAKDKSISDGTLPSNVAIFVQGPTTDNGSFHHMEQEKTPAKVPYMDIPAKSQTSTSRIMGKELVFVQQEGTGNDKTTKSNMLTTVPPTGPPPPPPPVTALTTTPPFPVQDNNNINNNGTTKRKQPAFLMNHAPQPKNNNNNKKHGVKRIDTQVVPSAGEIELQLSQSHDIPAFHIASTDDNDNDNDRNAGTKVSATHRQSSKKAKFLRKILPGKKKNTAENDPIANNHSKKNDVEVPDDADCGLLVSKTQLVQQGWSPGDIPDHVEPGTADLSLFGRLIALRKENAAAAAASQKSKRAKKKAMNVINEIPSIQSDDDDDDDEPTMEREIFSPETEDWEVLSRESDCLSEENEMKKSMEREMVANTHCTESSAGNSIQGEPFLNTEPLVFQIPELSDAPRKNRGLLGRVLTPRKRSDRKESADAYVSSVQASRGSQSVPSVPSVSGWSASAASSANSDNDKDTVVAGNGATVSKMTTLRESAAATREDPPTESDESEQHKKTNEESFEEQQTKKVVPKEEEVANEVPVKDSVDNLVVTELGSSKSNSSNRSSKEKTESSRAIEALLMKKSPVVNPTTNSQAETFPSSIFSNESDDGIPVPSVSVQELKAMLDSRSSDAAVEEPIQEAASNDVSLQAVRSRKRVFGLPRVFQNDQELNDQSAGNIPPKEGFASKTDTDPMDENDPIKKDPPIDEEDSKTAWKSETNNTAKALADSVSIQSSIEASSETNSSSTSRAAGLKDGDESVVETTESYLGIEMEPSPQRLDDVVTSLQSSAIATCGSIEDVFASNGSNNGVKKTPASDRKNVRFADSLETVREIPATSHSSSSSTFDDHPKKNFGEEKSKRATKSILKWISSRSRKRRSLPSKISGRMAAVNEVNEQTFEDESTSEQAQQYYETKRTTANTKFGREEVSDVDATRGGQEESSIDSDGESSNESTADAADGIELVARRTRSGKNAILITKTAATSRLKPPQAFPQQRGRSSRDAAAAGGTLRHSQSQMDTGKSSRGIRRSLPPSKAESMPSKGGIRLSLFKRGKSKRTRARTKRLDRKGTANKSPPPHQKSEQMHRENVTRRVQQHVPPGMGVRSNVSAANSSVMGVERNGRLRLHRDPPNIPANSRSTKEVLPTLSEGDIAPLTGSPSRTPSPEIVMETYKALTNPSLSVDHPQKDATLNPNSTNAFHRESSHTSRVTHASSAYSHQYSESSTIERDTPNNATEKKQLNIPISKPKEQPKTEDDWFSWLLPGIFSPLPQPEPSKSLPEPNIGSHKMGRTPSHGTSHTGKTNASRSTVGSSAYYGEEYSQDYTYSTPSVGSDDDQAVKSKRSIKKKSGASTTGNVAAAARDAEKEQIPVQQWQEILDATEVLAMSYKKQQKEKSKAALAKSGGDDKSVSDDTIDEVKRAIRKFREHAKLLGVQERDLMEAVRDDDRSVPSRKYQQQQNASKAKKDYGTKGGGGVTDKVRVCKSIMWNI